MTTKVLVRTNASPDRSLGLEGLVSAAFWIGVEHSEDDVRSVTVDVDAVSLTKEGPELQEFVTLLIQREIDFSVGFAPGPGKNAVATASRVEDPILSDQAHRWEAGYLIELAELKEALDDGRLTRSQYEENRKVLIAGWIGKVEGKTGGRR